MANTAQLKQTYKDQIAPELMKKFNYTSSMQIPKLKKIVINQGLGAATQDKKLIDVAINEISAIAGQKAVATVSKKDIANFKLQAGECNGQHNECDRNRHTLRARMKILFAKCKEQAHHESKQER